MPMVYGKDQQVAETMSIKIYFKGLVKKWEKSLFLYTKWIM